MKSPNSLCCALSTIKAYAKSTFQKSIVVVILLLSSQSLLSQQLAFPTAEGAGAYTTGGRGGIVVHVTNLNASGAGSFREAMLMTVPRIIVFDVSGRIQLTNLLALGIANSNFTVAGQTAPQGGITISGKPVQMGENGQACNNGIFRYIRFRNGSYTGGNDDYDHNGFISDGTDGLILDHCSFSFCDDQAISMNSYSGALKNITIQRCTFSENATQIIAGYAGTYPRGNMTLINNLFVDSSHRTPNLNGDLQWDIINNVYFNFANRLANANGGTPEINNIGNYYELGSYSSNLRANVVQGGTPSIYSANNYHSLFFPIPQLDDRSLWTDFSVVGQSLPNSYFTTAQHPLLGAKPIIKTASAAYTDVTSDVGANRYLNADGTIGVYQDSFDVTKIANVLSNRSSDPFNKNWTQPILPNNTRNNSYDTDRDGMPNTWEIANGLDPNNASDGNSVQNNGFTNLEYYLDGMTLQSSGNVTANAGTDKSICGGNSTTLTATGGSTYEWSTGETTASITVNPSTTTTYTATAFDSSGSNSDTDDVQVTVKPMPAANAGTNVSTCEGTSVTLTASGGDSYLWNTGATTATITVNPNNTTTYSVEATQNGCTDMDEVTVTVNSALTISAGTDVSINLGENITLSATGGDSYSWDTGETTSDITVNPTATTTYTVTGTSNGCEDTDTVKVTVLTGTSVTASAGDDVSICEGSNTTLTASGGATYEWSTGETTASIDVSPSSTNTYSVTVFDPTGINSDTDSVNVTVNPKPAINAGTDVSINLGENITLSATGGDSYSWDTGETTSDITVNPTATTTYTVTGTSNGCDATDTVKVTVLTGNTVTANAGEDVSICQGSSATLTASGGATYEWSTGATTASITVSENATKTYSVTAFDANGINSDTDDVTVTVNPMPTINAGTDVTINSGESITLTATGGNSYSWNTGATTASITVNPTTMKSYTVTGTSNGCEGIDTVTVTVLTESTVTANAGGDVSICEGSSTTLTASGGATYEWSTGETTASIDVSPGSTKTYSVTAFDTTGVNSDTDSVKVTVNPLPTINAGTDVTINFGETTTLSATGGNSYSWNTGVTTASITVNPEVTTTYNVTGSSNGCESSDSVTVTVLNETTVTANAGANKTTCFGYSVTLTASGGDNYLWSTGATTQTIIVNPAATTTYSVTAYIGDVQNTDEVTVFVNQQPDVIISNGEEITILEGEYITLSATGANSYQWNNGATQANIAVSPNATAIYSVIGYKNNCTDETNVKVNVIPTVTAFAGDDQTICLGDTVTLNASGGTEFLWSNGETGSSITVEPTETTDYSVMVYNEMDSATTNVKVIVNDCAINDIPVDSESFDFKAFPNPTSGRLQVRLKGLLQVSSVSVYDLSGNLLLHENITYGELQGFKTTLDLSPFPDGLYLVTVINNGESTTKKIVVQK